MRRTPLGRLAALLAVLSLGLAGIIVRLGFLQVRDARAFERLAFRQRLRTIALPATRGSILDRTGRDLALSLPSKDVYADPKEITHPGRTAVVVARVLHIPVNRIRADLSSSSSFVYLARQVGVGAAEKLAARSLAGIGFLDDARRYYPGGPIAPQVLGYVGVDGSGLAGLEYQYESRLAGKPGQRVGEIDPSGHFIPQGINHDTPPVPGEDVVTTIDREIQYRSQELLAAAVKRNKATRGAVIVMDPRTGDILAMAMYPWFDPNHFTNAKSGRLSNWIVTDAYEPGSVMKTVTVSAAVGERVIPLTQRLVVPDQWQVGSHVFHDAEVHPPTPMTIADIIAKSSNVGTIRVAVRLGPDRLAQYLARFGLGQRTGIGFPGEEPGILPPRYQWTVSSMGTIPVGQGLAVTPLQMAEVYATIANGGVAVRPRLVKGFVDGSGRFRSAPASPSHRVVSAATARTVRNILAYVVDAGTGVNAQIPGYWVAGKTGTALIPKANGGGYSNKYIASFIGFLPASRPQLLVEVVMDRPVTEFGSIAAAPLFHDVARYAAARLRITPAGRPSLPPHAIPYP